MDLADATRATHQANESPVVEYGARVGFAILGVLHLLIAWIAVKIAWGVGGGSKEADSSGALRTLAGSGTGRALLWVAVVGFLLLGVWNLSEGFVRRHDKADLVKLASKGVVYLFFAWTTFKLVGLDAGSHSEKQTEGFAAALTGSVLGRLVLVVVGLVILGIAGYHVYKGYQKKFLEDLVEHPGQWAVRAGRVGYIAKGVALVIVGIFFFVAAWTADAQDVKGLDGALKTFLGLPFGRVLLTLVALGIAGYGVYSFARARYARL
ncbi:DUF1206 domain-containing protein [Phycicoccus duodecadis]|uniref:Uncharacterized protein DUF1206 n=1 Tax=Phycicoccus duodecadis TaxID=173053 RepID=A0A2N3YJI5_9MICO|nr:DUF1206 domain-containing protein [Phycicoccus duodecadis]PKW27022.1 uncharacterized protein DUF1206 [Phycicoccus duodecadis]